MYEVGTLQLIAGRSLVRVPHRRRRRVGQFVAREQHLERPLQIFGNRCRSKRVRAPHAQSDARTDIVEGARSVTIRRRHPVECRPGQRSHRSGGRFGPHNIHENYAGSFQSETLIFSTWFAGGVRATDISDADRPEEVGYFVPPPPPGQPAIQINDVYVDANKLVYITDRISGGIYILEYTGS